MTNFTSCFLNTHKLREEIKTDIFRGDMHSTDGQDHLPHERGLKMTPYNIILKLILAKIL